MKDIDALVAFSVELADLSRRIIRSHSILDVNHEIKDDGSPVTPVDREVDAGSCKVFAIEQHSGYLSVWRTTTSFSSGVNTKLVTQWSTN